MSEHGHYTLLLNELNKIEFYFTVPTDKNRSIEGLQLRTDFANQMNDGTIFKILPGNCTALELLVSMAYRADDIMYDMATGPRPDQWFWLFIKNLGLDYLIDEAWSFDASNFVFVTISKWFDRRYSPKGIGSPYPNQHSRTDLSQVPIWDGLSWYLADNYDNM